MQSGLYDGLPYKCSVQYKGEYVEKNSDQSPHFNSRLKLTNDKRLQSGEFRTICERTINGSPRTVLTCTVHRNKMAGGHDLQYCIGGSCKNECNAATKTTTRSCTSFTVKNRDDCQRKCEEIPACNVFAFWVSDKKCSLKSEHPATLVTWGGGVEVAICTRLTFKKANVNCGRFDAATNKWHGKSQFSLGYCGHIGSLNLIPCVKACAARSDCKYISWMKSGVNPWARKNISPGKNQYGEMFTWCPVQGESEQSDVYVMAMNEIIGVPALEELGTRSTIFVPESSSCHHDLPHYNPHQGSVTHDLLRIVTIGYVENFWAFPLPP